MYNAVVDWVVSNYRMVSGTTTIIVFFLFLLYGYKKKGFNFTSNRWELADLILMLTSAYSTFTGLIIVLCCWHIEKLKCIQELWLYLIISGGALVYTCVYGILKSIDSK